MKIKTNSQEPGEPKDPDAAAVYSVYAAFATETQRADMRQAFADGIAWGEVKQQLFELVNAELAGPRERYEALINDPQQVERQLREGAERARELSRPLIERLREAVGIRVLS
jgi:tryptophanyl-tRNA synthetase